MLFSNLRQMSGFFEVGASISPIASKKPDI
jgi:hypothetical protein